MQAIVAMTYYYLNPQLWRDMMNHEQYKLGAVEADRRGQIVRDECAKSAGPLTTGSDPCRRLTARDLGYELICQLRVEAARLEALLNALPMELSYDADEALKHLFEFPLGR